MKNPEAMTFDELLAFRERLVGMIARMATSARRQLQAQIARLDGLTSGGKGGRPLGAQRPHALQGRKIPPKYRNPTNPSETWAGRGMMPSWMREQIKRGRKPEHFAIGKRGRTASERAVKRGKKAR